MTPLAYAWRQLLAGKYAEALLITDQVLAGQKDNPSALSCRAMARWSTGGKVELSLADLTKAIGLSPVDGTLRHNYATILASVGKFGEAAEQFRAALDINADDSAAFLGLVQCAKLSRDDPCVSHFARAFDLDALQGSVKEMASFALARVADAAGEAELAMRYAIAANEMVRRPYDPESEGRRLDVLRHEVIHNGFDRLARNQLSKGAPIFVVGMPRSGTTLVEALLASDDGVFAAGETGSVWRVERDFVARFSRRQKYGGSPESVLRLLSEAEMTRGATFVLDELRQMGWQSGLRFVDKTTDNLLRIGLIAGLFPDAKVINVARHPLDAGISNFFTRFHIGQGFSFSMGGIGRHTRVFAQTLDLWKDAGLIEVLNVSYEGLVRAPAAEAKRLFAFAGVNWDPACLDTTARASAVRTASHWQVRQPITTKSVGRWKAYEPWLDPMIEAMGGMDWINSRGYEVA